MIKSMTGYGKSQLSKESREYYIEIKSVNHRYLDINVKLPRIISYLEEEIKKYIGSKIQRGKVDIYITFEDSNIKSKDIKINKEIAKLYIQELKELAREQNILSNIEVVEISKFPDVLTIKYDEEDEQIKEEMIETLDNALNSLIVMRAIEGNKIEQDLINRLSIIEDKTKQISLLSTGLIQEYIVKLGERIKQLLKSEQIEDSRLAQEVVIYADKCSIEEEVTRLNSHIYQFRNLLYSDEAIGKKLDFLIQEMNREINTIGSKANSLNITNEVINIKTELENIREQVQNIE